MSEENLFSKSLSHQSLKDEIKRLQNKMKELKSTNQNSPTLIKKDLENLGYESKYLQEKESNQKIMKSQIGIKFENASHNLSIESKEGDDLIFNGSDSNKNTKIMQPKIIANNNISKLKNQNQNKIINNSSNEQEFQSPNKKSDNLANDFNQHKNNILEEIPKKAQKGNKINDNAKNIEKYNDSESYKINQNGNKMKQTLIIYNVNSISIPSEDSNLLVNDKLNSPDFLNIIKNEGNSSGNRFSGSNLNIVTEYDHFNPELNEKINFLKKENDELRKKLEILKQKLEYLKQTRELQLSEKRSKEEFINKIPMTEE